MLAEMYQSVDAQKIKALRQEIADLAGRAAHPLPQMTDRSVWKIVNEHGLFTVHREMRLVGVLVMLKQPTLNDLLDCTLSSLIVESSQLLADEVEQSLVRRAIEEARRWGVRHIDVTCEATQMQLMKRYNSLLFRPLNTCTLRLAFGVEHTD